MATSRTILPETVDMSASLDGSTVTFDIGDSYIAGTLEVYINGLRQTPGTDFTEGSRSFTLTVDAPESDENMVVSYFPSEAAAAIGGDGYASAPRQVADQYGTPRIMYD